MEVNKSLARAVCKWHNEDGIVLPTNLSHMSLPLMMLTT